MIHLKKKLTQARLIALSFIGIIVVGTLLLMLPISSRAGTWSSPTDALFTATSATCVTGLVIADTYTHWTIFGQCIILILIQMGGLGFMTIITTLAMFLHRKIGLQDRKILMQSTGTISISGVVRLIRQVVCGTVIFESVGACVLATQFIPRLGLRKGIYASVFHSVSAFCNAGFDVMGMEEAGSSLTHFLDNPVVNLTIMALIVLGGIGFLVWSDMIRCRLRFKKLQLHSKLVVVTTAILICGGWLLFFIFEKNHSMAGLNTGERLLASLFQSVTPRTAGFNTVQMAELSEPGTVLTTVLMFIGGSSGSTAGGIKTTTIAVLALSAIASARRDNNVNVFHYRLGGDTLRQASSIVTVYIALVIGAVIGICAIEPLPMKDVLFEVVSAVGTVGLSTGITAGVSTASKLILALLMYAGRIGGLTFLVMVSERKESAPLTKPLGKILVG